MTFNIYGIKFIFNNEPLNINQYFTNEWYSFKDISSNDNAIINVHFTDNINIPNDITILSSNIAFSEDSLYLYKTHKLKLNLSEVSTERIKLECSYNIQPVELFWLLERILFVKLIEKGFTPQHASCFEIDNKIYAFSSLKETGKSKILINFLENIENIKYISDDVLILDNNYKALPYPRGMSLHKFHGEIFYKLLKKAELKIKARYLIHLVKTKLLKRIEKFTIRLYLHEFIKKIDITTGPISNLYILQKKKQIDTQKETISKDEAINFLSENIKMEFFGIFYEEFRLLNFINNPSIKDFKEYLKRIELKLIANQRNFCNSIDIEKIVLDNNFKPNDIKKILIDD